MPQEMIRSQTSLRLDGSTADSQGGLARSLAQSIVQKVSGMNDTHIRKLTLSAVIGNKAGNFRLPTGDRVFAAIGRARYGISHGFVPHKPGG